MDLSPEEKRTIASLQRLSKNWPSSLWLYANGSSLHVMIKNDDGAKAMTPLGGFDTAYVVADVPIESDGGDW